MTPIEDIIAHLRANLVEGSMGNLAAVRNDPDKLRAYLEKVAAGAKTLARKRIDPLYAQMDEMFASVILENMDAFVDGLIEGHIDLDPVRVTT